jgi:hypothetical protein
VCHAKAFGAQDMLAKSGQEPVTGHFGNVEVAAGKANVLAECEITMSSLLLGWRLSRLFR